MNELDDAFLKFERGERQLVELLKSAVKTLNNDRVIFAIRKEPYKKPPGDPRPSWQSFTLYSEHVPAIAKRDGILLGEAVQSFRTSLDYLAWAFVEKYGKRRLSEGEKRNIQFPMSPNRRRFQKKVSQMLPNAPANEWAFFERYQPYRRSVGGRAIRCLRVLSNIDKHRIIVPVALLPNAGEITTKMHGGELVSELFHLRDGQEIRSGTKILTVVLAGNEPKVHMDTHLKVFPMFPRTVMRPTRVDRIYPIEPVMQSIRDVCFEILTRAKSFF